MYHPYVYLSLSDFQVCLQTDATQAAYPGLAIVGFCLHWQRWLSFRVEGLCNGRCLRVPTESLLLAWQLFTLEKDLSVILMEDDN